MRNLLAFWFAAGLVFISFAANAKLADAEIVFSDGSWAVRRDKDEMTDKPECTALYEDDPHIQLGDDGLYIDLENRGGVRRYMLRFNEEPALPIKDASKAEHDLNMIVIRGETFKKLLTATRFRLRIYNVLSETIDDDIKLNGLVKAHDFMMGDDCK